MVEKTYLGDSVYAEFDGDSIRLSLNNGYEDKSEIYLDDQVTESLLRFIRLVDGARMERYYNNPEDDS